MRYPELKDHLEANDPIERLVELTDQQVALEREAQAMAHSMERMQESLQQQYKRLEVLRRQKRDALEALSLQRCRDAGMSEEAIRAHFT